MALTTKNWPLNTYTPATWTDVVAEPATLATVVITNTAVSDAIISLRLEDAAASLSTVLPDTVIEAGGAYALDVRSVNVTGTQALQIQADIAGIELFVSGVIDAA